VSCRALLCRESSSDAWWTGPSPARSTAFVVLALDVTG
jgi:hypothetical protein